MALTFQQTDDAGACAPMSACAPAQDLSTATALVDVSMQAGGTPGSLEESFDIDAGTSVYRAFFQSGAVGQTDWPAGNWTVNLNVSTAQNDLAWTGVWVCRIDSNCGTVASVGSETTSTDISAGGVFSKTVSGTATTGLDTERVYVVCEFTNSHNMTARTVGITPSETVASPLPEPSVAVATGNATDVIDTSATLNGDLTEMTAVDSADVWFEWREAGTTTWNSTPIQTLTATGAFSASVTGLSTLTDYEFRAQASSGTVTSTGLISTFSTPREGRTIAGTVTEGATAVPGATVDIVNSHTDQVAATVTTDTNGNFSTEVYENGEFHAAARHNDGATDYNAPSFSDLYDDPALAGSASFDLRYDGPGINFTPLTTQTWETQGVAYSPDTGFWYVSEVTDTTTPSTIHELNADGTATGSTFQFPDGTQNHANALQWHNGHLWCSEYGTNTVFKVDWATKAIVGSFVHGNGTTDPDRLGAIEFIPTSTGGHKLLAAMWGSQSNAVYLLNYQDALASGSSDGHVFRTLADDVDTGRLQGLHYEDGALYATHDALPNGNPPAATGWGSYPVLKLGFPYADNLGNGDPLLAGRYVWEWLVEPIPYDDPIQDISKNPATGTFWVASEGTHTIYSGSETDTVNTLPDSWNDWTAADFAGPNNEWTRSIVLDDTVASGKRDQHIFWQRQPAEVEVWIHDDLADVGTASEKRAYVSVAEPQNVHNDTENALAINSLQSGTEYVAWNATDGWHLTGVARPSTAQWIKFRWVMDGAATTTSISKDGGSTWTQIRTYTHSATALGVLQPQVSTGSPTHLGPFTVTPL